jgi:bifunctional UDP-N-acetylglucosamine pyrophosphorylase/glucosamine-1-phosphate N-acetyltransferase
VFTQAERLGTAHAVLAARAALERRRDDVVVAFADTPLIRPADPVAPARAARPGRGVVVLGFEAATPTGYGRLVARAVALPRSARSGTPPTRSGASRCATPG